jgi:c-di-AMP phosphodiesterase-like protein
MCTPVQRVKEKEKMCWKRQISRTGLRETALHDLSDSVLITIVKKLAKYMNKLKFQWTDRKYEKVPNRNYRADDY